MALGFESRILYVLQRVVFLLSSQDSRSHARGMHAWGRGECSLLIHCLPEWQQQVVVESGLEWDETL